LTINFEHSGKRTSELHRDFVAFVAVEDLHVAEDEALKDIGLVNEELVLRVFEPGEDENIRYEADTQCAKDCGPYNRACKYGGTCLQKHIHMRIPVFTQLKLHFDI
jgi:hypothetical protein